ncbi:MAG: alternate-type signal peptide domain-containing protein [Propionibacteriaceae bacterium]|nr:alternate-type signal peptide domain-containing protein [Propionibacteriaceae bacterium]
MTQKSNKRRNAVIAAVAGAALFLGGSTYALWTATADLNGASISSGNLNLSSADDVLAYDVSSDRGYSADVVVADFGANINIGKKGVAVDLDSWNIVPGDKLALVLPFEVELVGDNLAAELTISLDEIIASPGFRKGNLEIAFDTIVDGVTDSDIDPEESPISLGVFGNSNSGGFLNDVTVVVNSTTGKSAGVVVMYVTFNKAAEDDMTKVMDLAEKIELTLTQYRPS